MAERDALDIDLYQARMLIGFHRAGMDNTVGTMEAFVRTLPPNRRFLVVCGIERIISYLKSLKITIEDVRTLKKVLPEVEFDEALGNYLTGIDFSKLEVRAMQDGDIAFASEPFISVRGPVGVAQFIEKKVLSILNHDIRIASKAARITIAAQGRPVAEFGGRRGGDLMSAEAARAAYIGGFSSTSNVLAFEKYGIPCIGTMGHVWIMAHVGDDGESDAYKNWSQQFPQSVYLPDTYHVYNGVEKILKQCGGNIGGIRFDSGDILENSKWVRRELSKHDELKAQLGATNDLNEYKIAELLAHGAPLDWFGVGTEVISTPDAPTCNAIYKLVEVDTEYTTHLVAKLAADGKGTLPGAKQVFRHMEVPSAVAMNPRRFSHDTLGLKREKMADTQEMLVKRDLAAPTITAAESRKNFLEQLKRMPTDLSIVEKEYGSTGSVYSVIHSQGLTAANTAFVNENSDKTQWGHSKRR
jgi:nicotinate phosphoribosyltransferase